MENLPFPVLDFASSISGTAIAQWLQIFGFDIASLIPILLSGFTLYRLAQYSYQWTIGLLLSHFTSHIEIDDWDPLYKSLIDWAASHDMTEGSRELKAVTIDSANLTNSPPRERHEEDTKLPDDNTVAADGGLFHFGNWYSKTPLIYKPNFSTRYFSHKGRLFHWTSNRRNSTCGTGYDHFVIIRCFGRDTKPIKALLHEVKGFTGRRETPMTAVYRSTVRSLGQWIRQSIRPIRPMQTISLDERRKAEIVLDINEYLQPATARWYAARGIPYRRGYLFHGPPGTGKTSLSLALAGVFGLSVYCVTLGETGLSETHLANLFDHLPERCIVLVEDVDTAGISREDENLSLDLWDSSDSPLACSIAQKKRSPYRSRSLISLAGLLNIIDGAASKEGRVLIMTTNRPEALDPALIRPGRVDHQVAFNLATRHQIRGMYLRMYRMDEHADEVSKSPLLSEWDKVETHKRLVERAGIAFDIETCVRRRSMVQCDDLDKLADSFAERLPEGVFSPAEIQGYLLARKTDAASALTDLSSWKEGRLETQKAAHDGENLVNNV